MRGAGQSARPSCARVQWRVEFVPPRRETNHRHIAHPLIASKSRAPTLPAREVIVAAPRKGSQPYLSKMYRLYVSVPSRNLPLRRAFPSARALKRCAFERSGYSTSEPPQTLTRRAFPQQNSLPKSRRVIADRSLCIEVLCDSGVSRESCG